jgi:ribosomal protein L12E/L44/L45/RPP1/RPP2
MSRAAAERATERIKAGLGSVLDDLRSVMEGRGWEAMGYQSWNAYLQAEFEGQSRGNIWRLRDAVDVVRALSQAEGEPVEMSVREALAVKRVAKARVRQSRPGEAVRDEDIVEAAREPDLPAMGPGREAGQGSTLRVAPRDPGAFPIWLEQLQEPLNSAAGVAGVDVREFIVAALLGACEGVTAQEILERSQVAAFDGEAAAKIAAKVGLAKATVQKRKRQVEEASRHECCGALKSGPHQNWCARGKGAQ